MRKNQPTSFMAGPAFRIVHSPPDNGVGELTEETIGDFKVGRKIGSGGMGVVYKAQQQSLQRQVALKFIKPGILSPRARLRFETEKEALCILQHDGIAKIHQAGVAQTKHGEQPFIVMEFIDGQPLTQFATERNLDQKEKLRLFISVCKAVQYAHQQSVIHRDLKPENILVANPSAGSQPQPKILDFSIARITDKDVPTTARQTNTGQIIGTPAYMSPEQCEGNLKEVDTLSDVYALGVILYELLCGCLPYDIEGKNPYDVIQTVLRDDPTPPSSVNARLRGDLETIITAATQKNKTDRYQSASAIVADTEHYLNDEPITIRPTSNWNRFRKFARRNRAIVRGAAAVGVALLMGIVGTAYEAVQAEKRADEALRNLDRAVASEGETRKLLADSHAQAARLAARRGDWRAAIENYEDALTAGHRDEIALRIGKIQAWVGLNRSDLAAQELDALRKRDDLGSHKGEVLLWQSDATLERWFEREKALRYLRKAIQTGLPPADEAYARGLMAESTNEAVALFETALRLDPFHLRANQVLGVSLVFLGRFPEARHRLDVWRLLYPYDPGPKVLLAITHALQHDLASANELLNDVEDQMGEVQTAALRELMAFLEEVNHLNLYLGMDDQQSDDANRRLIMRFSNLVAKLAPALGDTAAPNAPFTLARYVPPFLVDTFGRFLSAAGWCLFGSFEEAAKQMDKAVECHAEGTLFWLRGRFLHMANRLEEAEESFRLAVQTPSFIEIRPIALCDAMVTQWELAHAIKPTPDLEMQKRALGNCRELAASGSLGRFRTREAARIAILGREFDLARWIITDWQRRFPDDLVSLRMRMRVEFKAGAYGPALQAINMLLERVPGDPEATRLRQESLQLIASLGFPVEHLPLTNNDGHSHDYTEILADDPLAGNRFEPVTRGQIACR